MARTLHSTSKYELSIRWRPEDSAFTVTIPELPGRVTHGDALKRLLPMLKKLLPPTSKVSRSEVCLFQPFH